MITEATRQALLEILAEADALDKITLVLDAELRTVRVTYVDIDDEWFRDLQELIH